MTETSKSFVLPEGFKPAEDGSLLDFLLAHDGAAVRINAGNLRRLDTVLIELLLCAAQTWRDAGLNFSVTHLTSAQEDILMSLGLTADHLTWRVAA